jgi:hypothetical protein
MRPAALMPLACLLLAACGSGDKIDARNEEPAAVAEKVAASGMTPRPGSWEGTFRITSLDMPGLPPSVREEMNKSMGAAQRHFTCLTPEQAAKPDARFFQKAAEGCTYERFVMADGKIDAVMNCTPGSGPTKMAMQGTYNPDTYNLKITGSGEMAKGMSMNIAMDVTSRHVGACDGSEQ